jgi:hypothetical protein
MTRAERRKVRREVEEAFFVDALKFYDAKYLWTRIADS